MTNGSKDNVFVPIYDSERVTKTVVASRTAVMDWFDKYFSSIQGVLKPFGLSNIYLAGHFLDYKDIEDYMSNLFKIRVQRKESKMERDTISVHAVSTSSKVQVWRWDSIKEDLEKFCMHCTVRPEIYCSVNDLQRYIYGKDKTGTILTLSDRYARFYAMSFIADGYFLIVDVDTE